MGGCSGRRGSLSMGKTLCSFQTKNVVVLLFYREQGYRCAEKGRVVHQRREDLWQEGNDAPLTCRESTQVTLTRSLSDPGFPGSLCSSHAGSTFPACTASKQQEGQSGLRNNVPRPTASWCYFWQYWCILQGLLRLT